MKINWNAISSVSAALGVIISVTFFILQSRENNKVTKAEQFPYLEIINVFNDEKAKTGMRLRNEGTGLAIIDSMKISYYPDTCQLESKAYDWTTFTVDEAGNPRGIRFAHRDSIQWYFSFLYPGHSVTPDRDVWLLTKADTVPLSNRESQDFENMVIQVWYSNVFDERFCLSWRRRGEGNNNRRESFCQ